MKIKEQGRACIDCCENTHAVPVSLVERRCRGSSIHTSTSNQRVYKGKAWDSEVGMSSTVAVTLFRAFGMILLFLSTCLNMEKLVIGQASIVASVGPKSITLPVMQSCFLCTCNIWVLIRIVNYTYDWDVRLNYRWLSHHHRHVISRGRQFGSADAHVGPWTGICKLATPFINFCCPFSELLASLRASGFILFKYCCFARHEIKRWIWNLKMTKHNFQSVIFPQKTFEQI